MAENTENNTEMGIVERIMAIIKGGDEANVRSFFNIYAKDCKKEIKARETKINVYNQEYDSKIDEQNDLLIDAKEALNDIYLNVDPEAIKSKEAQRDYVNIYTRNIESKLSDIEAIEDKLESLKEEKDEIIKSLEEEIAEYKERINKIK